MSSVFIGAYDRTMQTLNRTHGARAEPLPPHAADCHMLVFGRFERHPLAPQRAYNVPEASLASHQRMKAEVGLERTVFVQASGHGLDNGALLAALAEIGARGRGVAVVAPQAPLVELQRLHKARVRGVRLNLYTFAERHSGDPATLLRTYERLGAPLGWRLQLFFDPDVLVVALLEARRADRQESEIFRTYIRDALPAKRRDEHHVARRHLLRRQIANLDPTASLDEGAALRRVELDAAIERPNGGFQAA